MNLSDYIKVYDNALDLNLCKELIDKFESDTEHQVKRDQAPYRFTEINIVQSNWFLEPLYNPILRYRQQYWKDCNISRQHVNPDHDWEEMRMKRYEPGTDEFGAHTDAWNLETSKRFLVYFWYLNDVTEGGETEFYGLDTEIKIRPEAGKLIMFPATWQYLHAGLPPRSGNKYILGGYLHHGASNG